MQSVAVKGILYRLGRSVNCDKFLLARLFRHSIERGKSLYTFAANCSQATFRLSSVGIAAALFSVLLHCSEKGLLFTNYPNPKMLINGF